MKQAARISDDTSSIQARSILPEPARELTFGEKAVGITFNIGGRQDVEDIKRASADLIDVLNNERDKAKAEGNGEKIALFTLAIRDIQSGQMFGVKAATWQH